MDKWMNKWMKGHMNEWMNEGMDGWRGGWMQMDLIYNHSIFEAPSPSRTKESTLLQNPDATSASHTTWIKCNIQVCLVSLINFTLQLYKSLICMCMLQISVNSRREDTVPCPTHGWVNSSYLCDVLMATLALVICAVTSSMTFVSVSTLTWNNHQTKLIKRLYMFSSTVSNQRSNVCCRCSPLYL